MKVVSRPVYREHVQPKEVVYRKGMTAPRFGYEYGPKKIIVYFADTQFLYNLGVHFGILVVCK